MFKILDKYVKEISQKKQEPKWMLDLRLEALKTFNELNNPDFGPELDIDFEKITYYKDNQNKLTNNWEEVQSDIKDTFCDLGVIKAEQEYLYGVTNQYESEVVYHNIKDKDSQIIFTSTDEALKKYPKLFKKYFNNLVKYKENKYTALNCAFWSGGSFIYIPKNIKLDRPLQSYFRIDSASLGQFEHTIIVVEDNAQLEYIEGCTAKSYSTTSLHAGIVEIYVGKNASCKYSTIQNWSKDVYNLVTKRAIVEENGQMAWIDGNIGSKITMKYPSCILKGDNAKGNSISIAYANENQNLDAGAKMIHLGKNTKSNIVSKSISLNGGVATYRGLVKITKEAKNAKATIKCDTIILDNKSKSYSIPTNIISNSNAFIEHEATISKVNQEQLFYLMTKGLKEEEAKELLVMGFIKDFQNELPLEYAVELNRLIKNY